jgi:uncharacterized protein (DUF1015 family)
MADRTDISSEIGFFPAVLFPMGNMRILSYNRIIHKLPEAPETFRDRLLGLFEPAPVEKSPSEKGLVSVYVAGTWLTLRLPEPTGPGAVEALDVGLLSAHILEPFLGITDPRRDPNISFVGGIRGTDELERLVDSGRAQLAFSMYPTSIEELVAVSDAGLLMPPKSTWFEPKLRSGLLVHLF